jgi:hypothetical protein
MRYELSATATDTEEIAVDTPHGRFMFQLGLSPHDGALVVFIDTGELNVKDGEPIEPTPDVLRLNVNDGPVWNYADAERWYGESIGHRSPTRGA